MLCCLALGAERRFWVEVTCAPAKRPVGRGLRRARVTEEVSTVVSVTLALSTPNFQACRARPGERQGRAMELPGPAKVGCPNVRSGCLGVAALTWGAGAKRRTRRWSPRGRSGGRLFACRRDRVHGQRGPGERALDDGAFAGEAVQGGERGFVGGGEGIGLLPDDEGVVGAAGDAHAGAI